MKKNAIIIFAIIVILGISAFFILNKSKNQVPEKNLEQSVLEQTYILSKEYVALGYQTDKLLINARSFPDYETWDKEMTRVIKSWELLEKDSSSLEKLANEMSEEKMSFNLISPVFAYDQQEISNVFDRAPAGKKIATLAKFLGVDANKAFKILKQDQAQVEADAWNEAGDTFKKLEVSATVIKGGCKIAGFVGGVIISGGTSAIAAGSTLTKAAVIVSGVDLTLEVTEDGANIALGDNNKISAIASEVKKITTPLASILTITDIPNNLKKGFDKFNAVMVAVDQANGMVQEGKIIGISVPTYTGDKTKQVIKTTQLNKDEIQKWLEENNIKSEETNQADIEKILGVTDGKKDDKINPAERVNENTDLEKNTSMPSEPANNIEENKNKSIINSGEFDSSVVGKWKANLQNTSGGDHKIHNYNWEIIFNSDGKLKISDEEVKFYTWKKEGNNVMLYSEDPKIFYVFQLSGNTMTLIKMVYGEEEIGAGQDFMDGKAIQGTFTKQL